MFPRLRRTAAPGHQREVSLSREVDEVEFELDILRKFLRAAPQIREESRYLVPPPEDFLSGGPPAPSRAEFKRLRRQSAFHAIKLVLLLFAFFGASVWFVDRLLLVMR